MTNLQSASILRQQPSVWMHIAWTLLVATGLHLVGINGGHQVFWLSLATFSLVSSPVWLICLVPLFKGGFNPSIRQALLIISYTLVSGVVLLLLNHPFFPLSLKQVGGDETALTVAIGGLVGGHALLAVVSIWQSKWRDNTASLAWLRGKPGKTVLGVSRLLGAGLLVLASNSIQDNFLPPQSASDFLHLVGLTLQVAVVYSAYYGLYRWHHEVLFRRVLQHQGLLAYLLGGLTSVVLFTALHGEMLQLFSGVLTHKLHPVALVGHAFSEPVLGFNLIAFLVSLPYILIVEWFRRERILTQLEAEKVSTELALLREQMNPHFFFNTLNNLYAMSLSGEERTPETILQLADLMRYVIYRGKEDSVSLTEEINYLRDYLDLQSLRLAHRLDLTFVCDKALNLEEQVTPLLFVILLENAFKHGIEQAEAKAYLSVTLEPTGSGWLSFTCENSIESPLDDQPLEAEPVDASRLKDSGLGLANLRRRLELRYPGRHELKLSRSKDRYKAVLKLQLTDH